MKLRALALAALLALPPQAGLAWNAAGHRLSAEIAWQQLDDATRAKIARLLRAHPDYERWLARGKGETPEHSAFVEASTWPDDIRRDPRFHHAGSEAPTAPLPGFPDMERHRQWHFADRPLGHAPRPAAGEKNKGIAAEEGELEPRLADLLKTLGNARAGLAARAYALPWLIHLVGDAHQPLHVVSRYDADGRGDAGGNALTVATPFHPRLPTMKLHAYWDDLPGAPWLRGPRLEAAARALRELHPPPTVAGTPEQWLEESWRIARDSAYPPGDDAVPTIGPAFHENAQEIARRRVAEAGYRLAGVLRDALGKTRPPKQKGPLHLERAPDAGAEKTSRN